MKQVVSMLIYVNKHITLNDISNKLFIFSVVKITDDMENKDKDYSIIINESGKEIAKQYFSANNKRRTNKPTKAKFNNVGRIIKN